MNVVWLSLTDAPPKGYWCYGLLEEIFVGHDEFFDVPDCDEATIIIPAEYHVDLVDKLNTEISRVGKATVILASDERGIFPVEMLEHSNIYQLWVMTPHFEKHIYPFGTKFLGVGYPQDARRLLAEIGQTSSPVYKTGFSGQITHERRHEMVKYLGNQDDDYMIFQTPGFTQGLGRREYYNLVVNSQTVPAPSGPVTLDSFRAYEALEAGSVPIIDRVCPVRQNGHNYWDSVIGKGHPLPSVASWDEAVMHIEFVDFHYPVYNNHVFSWWQLYKRRLRYELTGADHGDITVLVSTSPIPSHPSFRILEETLNSIRFNLPDADIIIMCDGVRDEQRHLADAYNEYVRQLCWECNFNPAWKGMYPLVSLDHQHQANMTRRALDYVTTSCVLFVEHDTPLVLDRPYDWGGIVHILVEDKIDMVRFHHEGRIHPEHEHLMTSGVVEIDGVPLRHTVQWSQRPHLATAKYYRDILKQYFPPSGRTMIEDVLHSWAQVYPEFNRLAIYHSTDPDGSIVRSYHLDGREEEPKYRMDYGT